MVEIRLLPPPPDGSSPVEVLRRAIRPRAEALAANAAALEGEYGALARAAEALSLELAELAQAAACALEAPDSPVVEPFIDARRLHMLSRPREAAMRSACHHSNSRTGRQLAPKGRGWQPPRLGERWWALPESRTFGAIGRARPRRPGER